MQIRHAGAPHASSLLNVSTRVHPITHSGVKSFPSSFWIAILNERFSARALRLALYKLIR
jgi:hypothetical protein